MHPQTLLTTYGCLLHDCERLGSPAGSCMDSSGILGKDALCPPEQAWKTIRECLGQHRTADLRKSVLPTDHPAYLVYAASRLAAADPSAEKEEEEPLGKVLLQPIFTHMNGDHTGYALPMTMQDGELRMPRRGEREATDGYAAAAARAIRQSLEETKPEEEKLNALLRLLQKWTSSIPSGAENPDISLYDHLKTTAAIGACLSEYFIDRGERDFRKFLFIREREFDSTECFLLYSADLSGIQKFIYTVSDHGALRSLRSRSFFLGLMMEHYIDELLQGCGLSRTNLLYSGGGHCYLLLPNTPHVLQVIEAWNLKFNDFLQDQFGTGLFLAHGWTSCCGNDLINVPAEKTPYKEMFRRVSGAMSAHKLHRYSPSQLLRLNQRESCGERECRVCGRIDNLKEELCPWCRCFIDLSRKIQTETVYVVSGGNAFTPDFSLPAREGMVHFLFTDKKTARKLLKEDGAIRRIYIKNESCADFRDSTRLYVGDYAASNLLTELTAQSEGIQSLAICRMDVDNLGQSFVRGFENSTTDEPREKYRYVHLARTAAFSRQMSLFFQLYINDILSGQYGEKRHLAVTIVYSGGDDVFLVGAWNDVIEAANRVQKAFAEFTCGSLTISGGIGLFDEKFPIRIAAARTAELGDRAKQEPNKDAISIFDPRGRHTYSWAVFQEKVIGEKAAALEEFLMAFPEVGNVFLYKTVQLLRPVQEEGTIHLARYAYQLARMEPKRSDPRWELYRKFADEMYRWSWSREGREQLITAIYLYVYRGRKG